MTSIFEPEEIIKETIILERTKEGVLFEDVLQLCDIDLDTYCTKFFDFCIDTKGNVRKAQGIIATDDSEFDKNYVPQNSFGPKKKEWSHSLSFTMELPNPYVHGMDFHVEIRNIILLEVHKRIEKFLQTKKAQKAIQKLLAEKEEVA